ncbi:MAG: acyl carrier protein [Defluviitaleaceae bacterium]|nr:acyl carrier protein [Defluviitaleaceae bacterium]
MSAATHSLEAGCNFLAHKKSKEESKMIEQLTAILRDYKSDDALQISEATTFEELELDSLDIVQLIMNIEEETGVTVEMDKAITDIGTLVKVMEESKK